MISTYLIHQKHMAAWLYREFLKGETGTYDHFDAEALASIIREPGPGGVSKKRRTLQLTWAFEETLGEWPTWPPNQDAIVGKQRFSLEKPGLIRCNNPSNAGQPAKFIPVIWYAVYFF